MPDQANSIPRQANISLDSTEAQINCKDYIHSRPKEDKHNAVNSNITGRSKKGVRVRMGVKGIYIMCTFTDALDV